MPDFEAVDRLILSLGKIGNLKSDGRPILGLDSRDLVEICLEVCEDALVIPAHIWTPYFAALGLIGDQIGGVPHDFSDFRQGSQFSSRVGLHVVVYNPLDFR
jgi:PHP family Zn ribbon phosphoesterase